MLNAIARKFKQMKKKGMFNKRAINKIKKQ